MIVTATLTFLNTSNVSSQHSRIAKSVTHRAICLFLNYSHHRIRFFSADVEVFLLEHDLISPVKDSKRKLSLELLSPPSTPRKRLALSKSVEVPALIESQEAYEFIGFESTTAANLWRTFCAANTTDPDIGFDFIQVAFYHISDPSILDATTSTDDWTECLRHLGVKPQLRDAITNPEFADVQYTATCKEWVQLAIDDAYFTLCNLDEIVRSNSPEFHSSTPSEPRSRKEGRRDTVTPVSAFLRLRGGADTGKN